MVEAFDLDRITKNTKDSPMDELIKQLVEKLGIDADTATAATGKAMAMVKQQAGDDLFSKIAGAIPGAGEAADTAFAEPAADSAGGGGLLGSVAGMASKVLGGSGGDTINLASALAASGLKADQIGGFLSTIIDFLKDKLGEETVDQLLAKVPILKTLVG
jgi:hypothetical protein